MINEGKNNLRRFENNLRFSQQNGKFQLNKETSLKWLKDFFKSPVSTSESQDGIIKRISKNNKENKVVPGNLYMFSYLAITKNIPYYDKFPLTIIIHEDGQHFWGLNLHYAPPIIRAKLLDNFNDVLESDIPLSLKLKKLVSITLQLSSVSLFKPLIKCYLKSLVRSKFIKIPFDGWNNIVYLPLARWEGADQKTVYKDFKSNV